MRASLILACVIAASAASELPSATAAPIPGGHRQYYNSWSYHPTYSYHYSRYYYRPTPTYPTYSYHYCIHYPSQPRYVYYYNPHSQQYWGRFDTEGKEGKQYSLLKPDDRKQKLEDIPESAFPEPGEMPEIPEGVDGTKSNGDKIEPVKNLPDAEPTPDDTPVGKKVEVK